MRTLNKKFQGFLFFRKKESPTFLLKKQKRTEVNSLSMVLKNGKIRNNCCCASFSLTSSICFCFAKEKETNRVERINEFRFKNNKRFELMNSDLKRKCKLMPKPENFTQLNPAVVSNRLLDKQKFKQKNSYTSYTKLTEIKLLTIGIATPLSIMLWSEKVLPNGKVYGQVLNANTLHHKTFKPQKGGLFCERIFGPLKDFECLCGKIDKTVKTKRKYCPDCDVEYTWSVIRRYQLGYIKLSSPVAHIWFLKGTPNYLSILLDIKKRHLQFVAYCLEQLNIEKSGLPFYTNLYGFGSEASSTLISEFASQSQPSGVNIESQALNTTKKDIISSKEQSLKSEVTWNLRNKFNSRTEKRKKFLLNSSLNSILKKKGLSLYNNLFYYLENPIFLLSFKYRELNYYSFKKAAFSFSFDKKFRIKFIPNYKIERFMPFSLSSTYFDSLIPFWSKFSGFDSVSISEQKNPIGNLTRSLSFLKESEFTRKIEPFLFSKRKRNLVEPFRNQAANFNKFSRNLIEKKSNLSGLCEPSLSLSLLSLSRSEREQSLRESESSESEQRERNIVKNSPVDLYILFSLERMLQKSTLIVSIQNTWKKIYRKSLIKAITKAKKILQKFIAIDKLKSFLDNKVIIKANTAKQFKTSKLIVMLENFLLTEIKNLKDGHKNGYRNDLDVPQIRKGLQSIVTILKPKFFYHVLNLLKNLKYPILALNSTSRFSQRNSFSSLEKEFSLEIEKYLLKKTDFMQNLLFKCLLNRLVLDIYCFFYNKQTNYSFSNYLEKSTKVFLKSKNNKKVTEKSPLLIEEQSGVTMKFQVQENQLKIDKTISELKTMKLLKIYKNYRQLTEKNSEIKENFSVFTNLLAAFDFTFASRSLLSLSRSEREQSLRESESSESEQPLRFFESKTQKQNKLNKSLEFNKIKTKKFKPFKIDDLVSSLHKRNGNKNWDIRKKIIYNNIYTLEYRFCWDVDKNWQIFSLFTFGITDFVDLPIPNYKHRLISLTSKNSVYPDLLSLSNKVSPLQKEFFTNFSAEESEQAEKNEKTLKKAVLGNVVLKNKMTILERKRQMISSSKVFCSGAGIIQRLLDEFDFYQLKNLTEQNRYRVIRLTKSIILQKEIVKIYYFSKKAKRRLKILCKIRDELIRQTKVVRKMFKRKTKPFAMILNVLPVLPPDLRPIVKMGNQIAASDLNRLYQKVIYRNERLKKILKDPAMSQSYEIKYAQRLLQEAVDNLIKNENSGPKSEKDGRGRALKSLSDLLKGKQGRFRQFLLGKRVDYSGRSVIVVGPTLKLHECGLPFEMAKELYLPFLLKKILNKKYAKTVIGAKTLILKNPSLTFEILKEIMQTSPILLNRAPTLHRLGIQAFIPKLIEGRAILLHPLVCAAFNADFDGDQMAVHLPITVEARAEAWKIMLSRNNLLSPATGDPLAIPSQDMVLGCYYLTTLANNSKILNGTGMYFKQLSQVLQVYEQRLIDIHAFVWVKCFTQSSLPKFSSKSRTDTPFSLDSTLQHEAISLIENGNDQSVPSQPFELRISPFGQWQEITRNDQKIFDKNNVLISHYFSTTPGRVLFNSLVKKIIDN